MNCDAMLPFVAQRHDPSPLGWAQIWPHDFSDAANGSRISTFRGGPSLPWAQGSLVRSQSPRPLSSEILTSIRRPPISEALGSGAGVIEPLILPHAYSQLAPLVGVA